MNDLQRAPTVAAMRHSDRRALLPLGMHRSGTSLLAYLMHVLGAALPHHLIGPGHGNPLGHWEPRALVAINDSVLQMLGRSWDDPRPIDPGWFHSSDARTFIDRLAASIDSEYGDAPLLLIKDPRICRLVPLYLQALAVLGIAPLIVIQLRPCADVVRSLADRNGMDADISESLWVRSVLEAERATRSYPRAWITLDQLFADWRAAIHSVMERIGLDTLGVTEEAASHINRFINPDALHRTFQTTDESHWLALNVWRAAQLALAGNEAAAQRNFDIIASALAEFDRLQAYSLSRTVVRYETQLDALYNSTSWRITKPLRALKQRIINAHTV